MRACPKCKSSDYNNRTFTLMMNVCGHSLCSTCVESVFARNSGPCPTCGRTLRKNVFWEQIFDDPQVEKEVYWRKRLLKIFNLKEEDFQSLREYNDYLEHVERLIDRLVTQDEVDAVLAEAETFRKENAERIERSKSRKSKDEEWIQEMLRLDAAYRERVNGYQTVDTAAPAPASKNAEQRSLIADLMTSDLPADLLIAKKRKADAAAVGKQPAPAAPQPKKPSIFFEPLLQDQTDFPVVSSVDETAGERDPYVYISPFTDLSQESVPVPLEGELDSKGYLRHVRDDPLQRVGGFTTALACRRALTDAFADILNLS